MLLAFGYVAFENGLLLKLLLPLLLIPGTLLLTAGKLPLLFGPGCLFGGKILLRLPPDADGPEKLLLGF